MKDEIRFTLTPALDFLEPMNLKARSSDLKAAIPLGWDALTRARGYDLQAVSASGDKDVVMWLAARNKSPMLPASQNECTIPEGIFAKGEMAMLTGVAHGPVQGFSFPPQKPGEKKPLIWSATVHITAFDSVILGMEAAATRGRQGIRHARRRRRSERIVRPVSGPEYMFPAMPETAARPRAISPADRARAKC